MSHHDQALEHRASQNLAAATANLGRLAVRKASLVAQQHGGTAEHLACDRVGGVALPSNGATLQVPAGFVETSTRHEQMPSHAANPAKIDCGNTAR